MKAIQNHYKIAFIRVLAVFFIVFFVFVQGGQASFAKNEMQFTQEEKIFIESHKEIKLGVDPQFIPYEFIDSDGSYKGIAADYIKLLEQKIGMKFTVQKDLTWTEAYEKGVLKQLDVLPCVSKTTERERYFNFSEPYYPFQRVIFINSSNKEIKGFQDLALTSVAVQKNSSHHSYLKAYKNIKINLYNNVEDALRAVAEGRESAFVGNFATTSYIIKDKGITNLKYVKIESEGIQYLYFAVRNDWPILVNIINKALADITQEEKITIDNRWIGVQEDIDYQFIIRIAVIVGSVILIIFIVSLYWIVKLKREVAIRKKTEEALNAAKEEAIIANQVKSAFLARMSHEIRTPLNAITGMAYLVKKTNLTSSQKMYLDRITRASKDMLGIINDILDFSKIEAGKIDIERISFKLDEVLEQIVNILSFKIKEQSIEFSMTKEADMPDYFWGDPKRIQQILLNVVSNAVKFTKEATVSFNIRVYARLENTYVIDFSVKDAGIGMSEEQLKQLFTPFNQADSSISRRFGGTGLGLSIVKSLTDKMGGGIEVSSTLGQGTTVTIRLKLEADLSEEYESKKKTVSAYLSNIRILVLQKNNFFLDLMKQYLGSFNMAAEFARSDEDALRLMEIAEVETLRNYDLLIIDYDTPDEGGIEFYKKIRSILKDKEMPKCILLLPLSEEELFEKLEDSSAVIGISKPIVPSVLYNSIVEIFKAELMGIYDNEFWEDKGVDMVIEYPYHVLIVEDNRTNQLIAKSILEQTGFRVSVTENGKEGYEFFRDNSDEIHVILMDLHMPVMDGLESSKMIRKVDKKVPIIAMTADAITGVEMKCKEVGIDYYISKPFEPDQFIETMCKVVRSSVQISETSSEAEIQKEQNSYSLTEVALAANRELSVEANLDMERGIKNIGGRRDLYFMVLKEYYDENKEVSQILSKFIEEKDYKQAIQVVHKIKGSSGSICANTLYEICIRLQNVLGEAKTTEIEQSYKEFDEALKQVLLEIEQLSSKQE